MVKPSSTPILKQNCRPSQSSFQDRYDKEDPTIGLLGEPSSKFDYYVKFTPPPKSKVPIIATIWYTDDDKDTKEEKFLPPPKPTKPFYQLTPQPKITQKWIPK